ncbi:MAG: hypothetical protein M1549_03135 [Candidatus Dependentiae bacterium]|nr:hypothetical protein [Candidatus Dependentiae bacterium]
MSKIAKALLCGFMSVGAAGQLKAVPGGDGDGAYYRYEQEQYEKNLQDSQWKQQAGKKLTEQQNKLTEQQNKLTEHQNKLTEHQNKMTEQQNNIAKLLNSEQQQIVQNQQNLNWRQELEKKLTEQQNKIDKLTAFVEGLVKALGN